MYFYYINTICINKIMKFTSDVSALKQKEEEIRRLDELEENSIKLAIRLSTYSDLDMARYESIELAKIQYKNDEEFEAEIEQVMMLSRVDSESVDGFAKKQEKTEEFTA